MRKQIIDVILTYYVMLPYAVANVGFAFPVIFSQKAKGTGTGYSWCILGWGSIPCGALLIGLEFT